MFFCYSYNILNQLTSLSEPTRLNGRNENVTHTYTYNANGDLIKDVKVEPLEDLKEELSLYPGYFISGTLTQNSTTNYTFDNAGRLKGANVNAKVSGTIKKLKDSNGNTVQTLNQTLDPTTYKETQGEYTYNGDGVRIKKDVEIRNDENEITSTVERKYYYTRDVILFIADTSNNKTVENIFTPGGEVLLSSRFEVDSENNNNVINGWYTFNSDIRGSVTSILRDDGSLTTGYVYDEFGNQIKTGEEDFLNEATYTGAVYDSELGLHYMNARYYNSETGQFISKDAYLGEANSPWTQNLYSYTGGNPTNYTDPTGHKASSVGGFFRNIASGISNTGKSIVTKFKNWWNPSEIKAKKVIIDNRENIINAAKKYEVDPRTVAAAIYTEHALNVDKRDTLTDWLGIFGINTSVGLGQVRMSTAKVIEDAGYVESSQSKCPIINVLFPEYTIRNRYSRLANNETNADYVAGYIKMINDTWGKAYPKISQDPVITLTLYNRGWSDINPHANPGSNEFGEAGGEYYKRMNHLLGL